VQDACAGGIAVGLSARGLRRFAFVRAARGRGNGAEKGHQKDDLHLSSSPVSSLSRKGHIIVACKIRSNREQKVT
jgi:hypothetical protein